MKLFFIFHLVFQLFILAACEIKKRGIYAPYSYSSLNFGSTNGFQDDNNWKLIPTWSNYLRDYNFQVSNKELYTLPNVFKDYDLQDSGFILNHLNPPWQFLNLADNYAHNNYLNFKPIFSPPIPVGIKTPVVSIPRVKLPVPAVTENPLPLLSLYARNNRPAPQDDSKYGSVQPPKRIPATATHPQSGAGHLGSGSLGYVQLSNGRIAIGSGSLGYTPSASVQLAKNNIATNTERPNFSTFFIPSHSGFIYQNQPYYNQN